MEAGGAPPSCASVPRGRVRTRELGKGATSRLISVNREVCSRAEARHLFDGAATSFAVYNLLTSVADTFPPKDVGPRKAKWRG